MKKLVLVLLVLGCSLPAIGQSRNQEVSFYQNLAGQRNINTTLKKATLGISRNFENQIILDSLLYFTNMFEKEILNSKTTSLVKPSIVQTAQKKYPGKDYNAITNRLKYYMASIK